MIFTKSLYRLRCKILFILYNKKILIMILQIIASIYGLAAIIGTSQGLTYSEEKHLENVMAEKKRMNWYRDYAIELGNKVENLFNIEKECECEEMNEVCEIMEKYNPA